MRKLLFTSTILAAAAVALPLSAGTTQQTGPPTVLAQATQLTPGSAWRDAEPIRERDIESLRAMPITTADGEEVGEIQHIVQSREGEPAAVVTLGRDLGLGGRTVAVPLSQLRRTEDALILSPTTSGRMNRMEDFDRGQFRPFGQPGPGVGGPNGSGAGGGGSPGAGPSGGGDGTGGTGGTGAGSGGAGGSGGGGSGSGGGGG